MIKLKTPLFFAGIGFLLSFLIGIVSGGIRFYVIILRALVFGIMTGGFIFGVSILLRRVLPELFTESSSPETPEENKSDLGAAVNITLDDDLDDNEEAADMNSSSEEKSDASFSASASDVPAEDFPNDNHQIADEQDEELKDLPAMSEIMHDEPDNANSFEELTKSKTDNGFSISDSQISVPETKNMARAIRTILADET
ncbi:hypothetical protein [Treponema phagedenis]|uniref:Uncharacterized protein n=1 Tax=Treponema phagedenis TaxID=162 RepID=A0AAE6IWH9_TREPH|nr:hypothetical protein [Treponema phagedenis]QEJ99423.1 hypothetical protein FUT82_16465 [Treponema phagedenis]QEJ99796.1 hypothetical protein FUT84_00450 [Treponema phagedenis]QEK04994.1 hypothetical protein FUT83_15115 [Treponema phagedenis]QEK10615.1 hypothetical protein FUT81_15030 [Treponema phagedenis]